MKKVYLIASILCLLFGNLSSQVPQNFNYQAVVRDDGGNLLNDQAINMRLSILQGSVSGTVVYSETHAITTNAFGLVTLIVGNGTVETGTFSAIPWDEGPYFMKVELDPAGGSTFIEIGTSQILSVPYALYSKTAENYTETDPVFNSHVSSGILADDITNWNSAFGWGDHSTAGYLTSYTETDPVFGGHVSSGILAGDITNWNSAFGWGDHSTAGYLTSYTETDPVFGGHVSSGILAGDITNWNNAFGWGDHTTAGYLTSYTETDPVFGGHVSSGILAGDITHWNTAYGWGDHTTAGYLTSYTETDPVFTGHASYGISAGDITNWNTAFSWGNHTTAGYGLLSAPNTWMADQIISHPGAPRLIIQDIGSLQSFIEFHDAGQNNGYIVFNHVNHNLYLGNKASGPQFEWIFTGDGRLITPGDIESGGHIYDIGGYSGQWNTAFSWGDHSAAGYLTANGTLNGLVESIAVGNSYFTGGNLGVGTSTPSEKLHVAGNLRVENNTYLMGSLAAMDINAAGTGDFLNLTVANGLTAQVGAIDELYVSNLINTPVAIVDVSLDVGGTFTVNGGGNLAYNGDVLFANTSGNVGIGTASPNQKLSVQGIIESISGGYMFPDASVQQTAAPIIKSGRTTVPYSIGPTSYFNVAIPFGYSFSAPPTVTVTGYSAIGTPTTHLIPSVYSVSTNSFVLVLYNTGAGQSGNYTFNWIAVGN